MYAFNARRPLQLFYLRYRAEIQLLLMAPKDAAVFAQRTLSNYIKSDLHLGLRQTSLKKATISRFACWLFKRRARACKIQHFCYARRLLLAFSKIRTLRTLTSARLERANQSKSKVSNQSKSKVSNQSKGAKVKSFHAKVKSFQSKLQISRQRFGWSRPPLPSQSAFLIALSVLTYPDDLASRKANSAASTTFDAAAKIKANKLFSAQQRGIITTFQQQPRLKSAAWRLASLFKHFCRNRKGTVRRLAFPLDRCIRPRILAPLLELRMQLTARGLVCHKKEQPTPLPLRRLSA